MDFTLDPQHILAFVSAGVAAALVIVSAFVRTMIPLRWLAVGSNVGFIIYGLAHPNHLLVLLHAVLLPVNLWRVRQMVQITRHLSATGADDRQLGIWLRPYMRSKTYRTGATLFTRGSEADRMYLLADGRIALPDVGRTLEAGQMFGEIAFFAPERWRSSAAVCLTPCTVLSIDEDTFKQLVYQNPEFGLEVMHLIAARLSQDIRRLQTSPHSIANSVTDSAANSAADPAPDLTQHPTAN